MNRHMSEGSSISGRRTARGALGRSAFLLTLLSTGCDLGSTAPTPQTAWTAEVLPLDGIEDPIPFIAEAAMISGGVQTAISIQFLEAPLDEYFGWYLRRGTCAGSGTPLTTQAGVFPFIDIDLEGTGDAFAVLPQGLSATQPFAVMVVDDPLGSGRAVGCGDMVEVVEPLAQ